MLEASVDALIVLADPFRLSMMFLGIFVGLLVGIIPGMGGTVGMSVLLPFVIGMEPFAALALMIGMAAVFHTSDTFPSVLLGVPGTSGSQATIMDGYPMARRGEGNRALGAAFASSMFGGVLGAITLLLALMMIRPLVLRLGSPELFMLALLGLAMVGMLARGAPLAGVAAGFAGLLLGTVGGAPAAPEWRYAFDSLYLYGGLPIAGVALGLFAIPELMDLLIERRSVVSASAPDLSRKGLWLGFRDALRNKRLVVQSSLLGTFIGVLPGLGGTVVDWFTYGVAKQTVRNNTFGQGDVRGVIAPEAANNAKESGTLVPTLLFGIPGGGTTAIMLGALILFGFLPGPRMLSDNLDATLVIIWTFALCSIIATGLCLVLSNQISKITMIRVDKYMPFLMVTMAFASYQFSRHWGDILVFIVLGIVGWFMKQLGWPRPPLLIGFVLAKPAERYLHLATQRYGYEWLTDPGVMVIGGLIVLILVMALFFNPTAAAEGAVTSFAGVDAEKNDVPGRR